MTLRLTRYDMLDEVSSGSDSPTDVQFTIQDTVGRNNDGSVIEVSACLDVTEVDLLVRFLRRYREKLHSASQVFDALGIEGSIHRCRHVFGTRLLRQGVHIRTVQKLMRHASLSTTANYTAVDEDELRAAILTLSPLTTALQRT